MTAIRTVKCSSAGSFRSCHRCSHNIEHAVMVEHDLRCTTFIMCSASVGKVRCLFTAKRKKSDTSTHR